MTGLGFRNRNILRNLSAPELYEESIRHNDSPGQQQNISTLTDTGALFSSSGEKYGRSPMFKRIVREQTTVHDVYWGEYNMPVENTGFQINRNRAVEYLNTLDKIYVVDGWAGWDPEYRLKVRVICSRPYHALFMRNMLIVPTVQELIDDFSLGGDFTVINGGRFSSNVMSPDVKTPSQVNLNFRTKEIVVLGTQYAGEMKKDFSHTLITTTQKREMPSVYMPVPMKEKEAIPLFYSVYQEQERPP